VGRRKARLQLEGTSEMVQSFIALPQIPKCDAQVVMGQEKIGPQLQRASKPLYGLGLPAHAQKGRPEVAEGLGIFRQDFQGGPATRRGPLEVAESPIRFGQVREVHGGVRSQADGSADQFRGEPVIPTLMVQHAPKMQCVRVARFALQDLLIEARGFGEATRLMHRDCRVQGALRGHPTLPQILGGLRVDVNQPALQGIYFEKAGWLKHAHGSQYADVPRPT